MPEKVDNVALLERFTSRRNAVGALYLTSTHLTYVDHENKRETWILHSHISSVTKLPLTPNGSPLQIRTKTFMLLTFIIPRERDAHDLYTSLTQLCQPANIEDLYCYRYNTGNDELHRETGWSFFDLKADFERMGVPNEFWSLTTLNKDYELCDTYPRYLFVPTTAAATVLIGSSKFRSRGRLPVLTYFHTSKAALSRCSQPLSGFSARCIEDENLFACIQRANPNMTQLIVLDTRPRINAFANRAAGKGYESEANYENTRFHFAGIDNIHVMRSSLSRILETCESKTPAMSAFLNGIESSGWLRHIKSIVDASLLIASYLEQGSSVLVHCSDGWDRTAQVCALAQLLLDPYYRTLHGFQALIAKEWLAFGHKFTDRGGQILIDGKEVSPVFTQFLECVWQLKQQFPTVFQFHERLLICIHDHVHSCQFGTFVGNCQKDRVDLRLEEKTYSLWGYIANHMIEYLNPLYKPETNVGFIQPNASPQSYIFWREMYCRWENGVHPRESISDILLGCKDHISSLEDHIRLLQKRLKMCEKKPSSSNTLNGEVVRPQTRPSEDKTLKSTKHNVFDNVRTEEVKMTCDPLMGTTFGIDMASNRKESLKEEKPDPEECITIENLANEVSSVALDWKTVRGVTECSCSSPLDFATKKSHCWRCGEIFCPRCLDKCISLPGHFSQSQSPVCRQCFKLLLKSSFESPE